MIFKVIVIILLLCIIDYLNVIVKELKKLNEHYYHDEPVLIDDMAHKINEIIDKVNGEDDVSHKDSELT